MQLAVLPGPKWSISRQSCVKDLGLLAKALGCRCLPVLLSWVGWSHRKQAVTYHWDEVHHSGQLGLCFVQPTSICDGLMHPGVFCLVSSISLFLFHFGQSLLNLWHCFLQCPWRDVSSAVESPTLSFVASTDSWRRRTQVALQCIHLLLTKAK